MRRFFLKGGAFLRGKIRLPGDKSISHRSIILSALSKGKTTIKNFPGGDDVFSTVNAFKSLGIKITGRLRKNRVNTLEVFGKGLFGLRRPKGPLFLGDSGTTFRLLLGVLAGQNFRARLTAGKSLSARPMLRVTGPLRLMGARIEAKQKTKTEEYPPITIHGGKLKAVTYKIPLASAQVKSAVLLAGLYAQGKTSVIETQKTRDHTERMLKTFKADIKFKANTVVIKGRKELVTPGVIYIPGDISSAGFFMVAATILKGSEILIKNVNLNPTRMGIIRVLQRMKASIKVIPVSNPAAAEPTGDILIKSSALKATTVKKEEIPSLIDELPVLMVAACFSKGQSVFEGVSELRVKETDRIRSMALNLNKMGARIDVKTKNVNGKITELIVIQGVSILKGTKVKSFQDHRTAMSMIISGLAAGGKTEIDDISCINKSFPEFLSVLKSLQRLTMH
jgi:3-phosphoshikimate 1-carboxyvinyltransferase